MMRVRNPRLLGLLLALAALPLAWEYVPFARASLERGADDRARQAIRQSAPNYQPWTDVLWRPPNSTAEKALFTAQALGGALLLYWAIEALRKGKRSGG